VDSGQQRVKLIAMIGSVSENLGLARDRLGDRLGVELSEKFGGLFMCIGEGFWSSVGEQYIDSYPRDSIRKEPCLYMEVSVLVHQAESAKEYIRERCRFYNRQLNLGCTYLHLEQLVTTAHHCRID